MCWLQRALSCWACAFLPVLWSISGLESCNLASDKFESISEHGFDFADNQQDHNDYPWAMTYYVPEGADAGALYVGTGNCVMREIMYYLGVLIPENELFRPPEIRRYRPDLGTKSWEVVLDYRDIETGPDWRTTGFRSMTSYRNQVDGARYLYAGTVGHEPALWRSEAGGPGSWNRIWTAGTAGSIRALVEHEGLLYIAVTHEQEKPAMPGEVYVTDGATFWQVNGDGFGNLNNVGVYSLASFNGSLYAGTANRDDGYEIWKLDSLGGASPKLLVEHGGPCNANVAAGTMRVFQDRLYVGGLIFAGVNMNDGPIVRGADLIRIAPDDSWEVVSGPGSISDLASGLGSRTNAYLWSFEEFEGELYCGTWDSASFVRVTQQFWPYLQDTVNQFTRGTYSAKRTPQTYDVLTGNGANLFKSSDGVHWEPVFRNGLGNPDNYGIRNIVAAEGTLFLGFSNIEEGLEIFRMRSH